MKEYNKDTIVSMEVYDKEINTDFIWIAFKKNPWYKSNIIEGFRYNGDLRGFYAGCVWSQKDLECGDYCNTELLVENHIVYRNPCVIIEFTNGDYVHEAFDTFKDAIEYYKYIKEESDLNFIDLGIDE